MTVRHPWGHKDKLSGVSAFILSNLEVKEKAHGLGNTI